MATSLTRIYRITIHVPTDSLTTMLDSLSQSGLLVQGNYQNVYWHTEGVEQFTPLLHARPSYGEIGSATSVASTALVFSVPHEKERLTALLAIIRGAHPWEEPVIYIDESFMPAKQPE